MTLTALIQPTQRQHIAVLILIPLIMAAINSNWLYTPLGYLDPWYNLAYFLNYGDPTFRPAHYKISRLSWILPGWVLYQVFRPIVANFVLHVGALLIATIFTYLTLARLVVRDAAFLAAVFLTVYFPFLGSGGWDYQTTGSGAFYALTLYCLTRAGQSANPAPGLFAAGAAFAATFHANILFVNMVPVLVCQYFVAGENFRPRPTSILHALGWALAGAIALTLALCLTNWLVGRQFLFFQPQLTMVFGFVKDASNNQAWWSAWSTGWPIWHVGYWPAGAYYLAVPLATLLAGGFALLRAPRGTWDITGNRSAVFLVAQFGALAVLWIVWQSLGQTALEPDYFAYPLIIPCMLALGGLAAMHQPAAHAQANRLLPAAALLLAVIPGMDITSHLFTKAALADMSRIRWEAVFFLIALLLAAAMIRARSRPLLVIAMIAIFDIYFPPFLDAITAYSGPYAAFRTFYAASDQCVLNRSGFAAFIMLDQFATEVSRPDRIWIWYGPPEAATGPKGCGFELNALRGGAESMGLNRLGMPSETSASQLTDAEIPGVGPGDWVAVITLDPSNVTQLRERLRQAHHLLGLPQRREVMVGHTRVFFLVMPVLAMPQ